MTGRRGGHVRPEVAITSVEQVERELTFLLRRAERVHLHDATGHRLLDRSAYTMLGHLHDHGPLRPTDLADALGLDLSTVSRQVSALQGTGWVRRHRDSSDRRATRLALTPVGRDALRRTRAHRRQRLHDLLAAWPDRDVDLFADLLARFNRDLRTAGSPAGVAGPAVAVPGDRRP